MNWEIIGTYPRRTVDVEARAISRFDVHCPTFALSFVFAPTPLEEYAVYELGDYEGLATKGIQVPVEFYELPEGMEKP